MRVHATLQALQMWRARAVHICSARCARLPVQEERKPWLDNLSIVYRKPLLPNGGLTERSPQAAQPLYSTPRLHTQSLALQASHVDTLQVRSCCRAVVCLSARCRRPSPCCTHCRTACTLSRPPSPAAGPAQWAAPSLGSAWTRSYPAAAAKSASSARELPAHA